MLHTDGRPRMREPFALLAARLRMGLAVAGIVHDTTTPARVGQRDAIHPVPGLDERPCGRRGPMDSRRCSRRRDSLDVFGVLAA